MAGVRLSDITKIYPNGVKAVDDVSLDIADHEFVVLVGPSGCGKSTTLRLIAGLESAGRGEIRIGDRVVNNVAPKDRDVAMVFQNYALYPHMSVYGNLSFALRLRLLPPLWRRLIQRRRAKAIHDEIRRRVLRAADMLDIRSLLDRKPRELSGGQRQRVAVGRAIVRDPAVFLFDEPLSNLDARLRLTTRTELKRLHQQLRVTTVYVTHDQEEAMTLGERIVVMLDGKIQQADPPLQTYHSPKNRFVAGFIGTPPMNFFDGAVLEQDGELWFREAGVPETAIPGPQNEITTPSELTSQHPGFTLPLSRLAKSALQAMATWVGRRVVLGIRPEHLSIKPANVESDRASAYSLKMRVVMAEPLGSEIDLYLATAGHASVVARVQVEAGEAGGLAGKPALPSVGEEVEVHVDLRRVHLFEPGETGMNLSLQTMSVGRASDELSHAVS